MTVPALSVADLKLMGGEPRVLDLRLGERLGYGKAVRVRDVVRRNIGELECQGEVFRNLRTTSSSGGRPETEFYLNETQAVLVCMFARTPVARQVRAQIAEVFLAYRHGRLVPAAQPRLRTH
ncbi:hypothetical protein DBR17_04910 [Sphingomonas sp. HMWF008]|nr:hypothetical protein DBR17_04910 [Sphingomonas sp. HMWF008]